ncbi:alpha-2-HS-glycoprotein 2 [Dunckerocampus dactyliophorus]|uniref:alpha-2-HS-glycoprotein 2 n=1 Tax=Dunckerocampus dactyliophorus TaxID=161453 RepID=UPI002405F0A8|nr:alpha-2-HS-glycoprotein 2 [Dunckerocampus dactyliophorus]
MNPLTLTVVLIVLAAGYAQLNVLQPECDSPEAEEAALVAQDYLNAQHTHGYKYALNRIEDIKILTKPDGDNTYVVEVDLLETDCHVLDPTPVANCTVRPKVLTAVEGDCDVVLKRVGGALAVTAFKCKTEESTEDLCVGCPSLLPLNDTRALDFVHASLATFNNITVNVTYALLEVGRMSTQIVSGGPRYLAEYVVAEANCTNDACVPLTAAMATHGICIAKGLSAAHTVDCKMFPIMVPPQDANSTGAPNVSAGIHVHTHSLSRKHGLRHHKLTSLHDPHVTGLLSAESAESAEVVPVVAVDASFAPVAPTADTTSSSEVSVSLEKSVKLLKRDVSAADATVPNTVATDPILLIPRCPGRVRYF